MPNSALVGWSARRNAARAVWLVLTFLGSLPLLGANTSAFPPPIVVVYPLTQTGGTSQDAGSNIAILLATKLGQLGGITVKPYTPGTERAQYLENAIKENADYYVTGFLTPVGDEISMISQVVSTHSGSVVYSTTIAARTYADAAGQADLLHDAILRHAGRALAALDAPPPAPSGTPESDAGTKGVNLTKALRRHQRSTPTPSPAASGSPSVSASASATTVASAPKPALTAAPAAHGRTLVIEVGGDGDAATRTALGMDFSRALILHGYASGYLPVGESEVHAHAHDLCAANAGTSVLLASTLALGHASSSEPNVQLDVIAYDCAGTSLGRQRVVVSATGRGALATALHRAAVSAAAAFAKAGIPTKPSA